MEDARTSALAHALWDLLYTSRLSENPDDIPEMMRKAETLRRLLRTLGFDVYEVD